MDENCKHPLKRYENPEQPTAAAEGYTCLLCGKVVVFTEEEKAARARRRMESHPEENEPAFPIQGHLQKDYEFDMEVERLKGEKPGVTLLEHYALMCPLPWDGKFDYRDNERQRQNSLASHAQLRLIWARAMLHALRPVKNEGEEKK